jgi:dTDP-L-rhamnose 4-epimerase
LLAELAGAPEPRVSGKFRDGDVRAASCDVTPAKEELGWVPEWDLRRGFESLLRWVAEQ